MVCFFIARHLPFFGAVHPCFPHAMFIMGIANIEISNVALRNIKGEVKRTQSLQQLL